MKSLYGRYVKRGLDIVFSLLLLIVLSPVIIGVSILVAMNLGTPVLFKQVRPGLNENLFTMIKFRSMTSETDLKGNLLPDEVRLTNFGKVLRLSSLDELPELFNILRGEMSFVGPRPLLSSYLPLYNKDQKKRHNVRPGLTGLAQVNGRNDISWEKKLIMDVEYVQNKSFILDFKIICKTFIVVVKGNGVSSKNQATTNQFEGTKINK